MPPGRALARHEVDRTDGSLLAGAICPTEPAGSSSPSGTGFAASPCATGDAGRCCGPSRASRWRAIFPRSRRCSARLPATHFVIDGELVIPTGGAAAVRCAAAAAASGREPHPQAGRRDARRCSCCSTAWRSATRCSTSSRSPNGARRSRSFRRRKANRCSLLLSPTTDDRETSARLARARRRGARRRHRQAARRALPAGRAGDAQGQAAPHRRLRGRRLPLRREERRGRLAAARPLTTTHGKLDHVGFTSAIARRGQADADRRARGADRPAGLHRQCAGRAEPLGDRAHRPNGSRCATNWWSRCATTRSRAAASAMARDCSAGGPTRRRGNAPATSSAAPLTPARAQAIDAPVMLFDLALDSRSRHARRVRQRGRRAGADRLDRRRRPQSVSIPGFHRQAPDPQLRLSLRFRHRALRRDRTDSRLVAAAARSRRSLGQARSAHTRPGAADPLRSRRRDRLASRPATVRPGDRHLARRPCNAQFPPADRDRLPPGQAPASATLGLPPLRRGPAGLGTWHRQPRRLALFGDLPKPGVKDVRWIAR